MEELEQEMGTNEESALAEEMYGMYAERHALCVERIAQMQSEDTVAEPFCGYFRQMAHFFTELENVRAQIETHTWEKKSLREMQ